MYFNLRSLYIRQQHLYLLHVFHTHTSSLNKDISVLTEIDISVLKRYPYSKWRYNYGKSIWKGQGLRYMAIKNDLHGNRLTTNICMTINEHLHFSHIFNQVFEEENYFSGIFYGILANIYGPHSNWTKKNSSFFQLIISHQKIHVQFLAHLSRRLIVELIV